MKFMRRFGKMNPINKQDANNAADIEERMKIKINSIHFGKLFWRQNHDQ